MNICIHTNIPSFHQEDLIFTLAKKCNISVRYESDLFKDRKLLGWSCELSGYDFIFEKDMNHFSKYLLGAFDYHIISGFPGSMKNIIKVLTATKNKKLLFQSECPSKVSMKWLLGSIIFRLIVNQKKIILLGIGEDIRKHWEKIGVLGDLIFPWGYFIDKNINSKKEKKLTSDIIFVGQLIHRKGIDILLKAFSVVSGKISNNLILVGVGHDKFNILDLINQLKLQDRVKVLGSVPSKIIQEKIADASLLILPSRYDGWGVVTNEAILNNTPIIISDKCGSKELVEKFNAGYIFRSEDHQDLANKIFLILSNFEKWNYFRENCKKYSGLINTNSASEYLINIIKYSEGKFDKRPAPPWFI